MEPELISILELNFNGTIDHRDGALVVLYDPFIRDGYHHPGVEVVRSPGAILLRFVLLADGERWSPTGEFVPTARHRTWAWRKRYRLEDSSVARWRSIDPEAVLALAIPWNRDLESVSVAEPAGSVLDPVVLMRAGADVEGPDQDDPGGAASPSLSSGRVIH